MPNYRVRTAPPKHKPKKKKCCGRFWRVCICAPDCRCVTEKKCNACGCG